MVTESEGGDLMPISRHGHTLGRHFVGYVEGEQALQAAERVTHPDPNRRWCSVIDEDHGIIGYVKPELADATNDLLQVVREIVKSEQVDSDLLERLSSNPLLACEG